MFIMSETIQIIGGVTGLVGTVGGVVISYLTLRHTFRKDRHKIQVKIAKSILAWPQPGTTKPKWSKDQFTFGVANIGLKEYTVVQVGVQIGRRSGGLVINQPNGTVVLPHKLLPDQTCDFWTEYADIVKTLNKPRLYSKVKVRGYVRDYLDNSFYSNKMTIVLKETRKDKTRSWIKKQSKRLLTFFWP